VPGGGARQRLRLISLDAAFPNCPDSLTEVQESAEPNSCLQKCAARSNPGLSVLNGRQNMHRFNLSILLIYDRS
jgi:hypothetical protein